MSVECVDRRNNFAARKIFLPDWWLGNYSIGLLRADNLGLCSRQQRDIRLSVLHDRSVTAVLIAAGGSRRWLVEDATVAAYLRLHAFYFYDTVRR